MKLITEKDKIDLRHLDILMIKTAPNNPNNRLIISKLITYQEINDMEILNTDYGEKDELV